MIGNIKRYRIKITMYMHSCDTTCDSINITVGIRTLVSESLWVQLSNAITCNLHLSHIPTVMKYRL